MKIAIDDGHPKIDVVPVPMRLVKRAKGVVAVPDESLPPLSAGIVRKTLESIRRRARTTAAAASRMA